MLLWPTARRFKPLFGRGMARSGWMLALALGGLMLAGLMLAGLMLAGLMLGSRQALAHDRAKELTGTVAITFDDLPAYTILLDQDYVDRLNADLLAGLKRHHIPATGFVVEGKLDELVRARQIAVLKNWQKAGMGLGNHTFSHESPNTLGAQAYIADIAKGEPVTRSLLAARHQRLTWFRHPYLETGKDEATQRTINDWLAAHRYRIAPVTIDADDWEFAEPYDDAITHHNDARRAEIRAEYLDYTEAMIGWSQQGGKALFGRDIALVMMLHDSRLNADCIDDLAAMLTRHKLRPVKLAAALKDPAYRTPAPYTGGEGIEWLERWSLALNKPLPWDGYRDMPQDIAKDYARVDNDQN